MKENINNFLFSVWIIFFTTQKLKKNRVKSIRGEVFIYSRMRPILHYFGNILI